MNYSDKMIIIVNKQNYLLEPKLDITAYESVMIAKLIAIVTIYTSQGYNYDTKRFIDENELERHFTIQENI
jgi:hypothetical protein